MEIIEIIGILITTAGVILGGVWFIIKQAFIKGADKNRLENIETKINHADCLGHKAYVQATDLTMKTVNTDLAGMKKDIAIIKAYLIVKSDKAANIFSVKNSPRKLNDIGQRLFEDIKGEDFLIEHQIMLFEMIESNFPKSALDVESYAKLTCLELIDSPIFKRFKDFVYKSPSLKILDENGSIQSYDVTLGDVCFVLSVPLRDLYLSEHTEINIEDFV